MFRCTQVAAVVSAVFRAVTVLALAVALGAAADAQTKPFRIVGGGVGPSGLPLPGEAPRMHWAIGQATHLGRYFGEGGLKTDSAVLPPVNGQITGNFGSSSAFVFRSANGDKLVTWYGNTDHGAREPGSFVLTIVGPGPTPQQPLVNAEWVAEFVAQPHESTGRFRGTTGSWVMNAKTIKPFVLGSSDPVYYIWEGEGRLHFRRH